MVAINQLLPVENVEHLKCWNISNVLDIWKVLHVISVEHLQVFIYKCWIIINV